MSLRWGIIGCGDVAEHKGGPALYNVPQSELTAVMSRSRERAERFALRHGARRAYTSVDDLLDDPEVDAVYIATPPDTHRKLTERAAQAGLHVLCEKPMSTTVADCESMVQACREAGVQLAIAYYRRFWPVIVKMREIVTSGVIGQVVRGRVQVADYCGIRSDGPRSWLLDPAIAGGGFLTDVGTHRLDLLSHFLGNPEEVCAMVDTLTFDFPVDDSSSLLIRFEGGVHATAEFNWNVGAPVDEFELCGTQGRLIARNLAKGELEVQARGTIETFNLPAPAITHYGLVEHFVQSVLSGTPNDLPGEAGMQATRITEAAYRSADERCTVMV